ncbi:agmatinase [Parasporobacterium paucivorans]|uniref:Agmatinase n=1 Tax=Parasporobacterium paucivorans DSM 15970 TaxID=1122934 RepID=A0A1M6AHL2_9FIRM|nr:agmatinase [Parasporobacterium paucivorans]SHI35818.1 agmatinase [Parasporobacterium paucivorans DSM 15970]
MLNQKNNDNFLGGPQNFEESDIVIFGAPFDSTTSYRPGTRFGPKSMRSEFFGIETYSPYQDLDLADFTIYDAGDLDLCFGDCSYSLKQIEDMASEILAEGKLPFLLGGEHLVTLGNVRASAARYPDLHILHLDAHADLRDDYLGMQLSHACVIRRCHEILGDGRIFQFGIRSGDKSEFEFAKRHTYMNKFNLEGLENTLEGLRGKPVYLTIDLDILDPSVFPGTGTPEPGGLSFHMLLEGIMKITESMNIVACDLNELSPTYDSSGISTMTACKLLREILLSLSAKQL